MVSRIIWFHVFKPKTEYYGFTYSNPILKIMVSRIILFHVFKPNTKTYGFTYHMVSCIQTQY